MTIAHHDCTKNITSLIHQFCYQGKKDNPSNLAKPKLNHDQFLLQPNFSHLIFYAFVTIPHQDFTKTITSLIHQFCYQGKKSQSPEHGYTKTQPRWLPFATKLFTPHFWGICDNSSPRFHKNNNLTYSPILLPRQKNPIHRTSLSQNPTKMNSFCNQTIHTSFFMHLWQFPSRFHKNHNFTYSPILLPRQKKSIHRTCLNQNPTKINTFCNQTFHTSLLMHLWQFATKISQKQ